jgi:hypothetical protein
LSRALGREDDEEAADTQCAPEYPIVPKFSEQYDYVVIFSRNSVDFANLCQLLRLETARSYKNTAVGISRVLTYDQFTERWKTK